MARRERLIKYAGDLCDQRASTTRKLKDVAAELWRDGMENIREISRHTELSRTTVYAALRERGIEPTRRTHKEEKPCSDGSGSG